MIEPDIEPFDSAISTDSFSEAPDDGDPVPRNANGPGLNADDIPVEMRFVAGSVTLPFAQLETIRPGFVFELSRPLTESPIQLIVNGAEVARGELVQVGDLLGVRVTSFPAQPPLTSAE